jgi:hypothetical protein
LTHIDKTLDPALPKSQNRMRRSQLEFAEECDSRDTRKFTDERCDSCRALARTADRHENRIDLLYLQVVDYVVNALTVQGSVASFASSVDTQAFLGREQCSDWWKLTGGLSSVGHDHLQR